MLETINNFFSWILFSALDNNHKIPHDTVEPEHNKGEKVQKIPEIDYQSDDLIQTPY